MTSSRARLVRMDFSCRHIRSHTPAFPPPSQPSTFDLTCCVSQKEHNLDFYIGRHVHEDPSVIQMGGSVPEELARATEVVAHYGNYSEFNLNCGCPSPKVRLPLYVTQQWHTVYEVLYQVHGGACVCCMCTPPLTP